MKTERMTVLLTRDQKAAILTRAQSLGLSTGEMVRRAVESYEPGKADEAALDALGTALQSAAKDARKALASARRELDVTLDQLARKRQST